MQDKTVEDLKLELEALYKQLDEFNDTFKAALCNSPTVLFNQDRDLRFVWMYNPQHGFDADEIIGKTDFDLLCEEEAAVLAEIKNGVMERGVAARAEIRATVGGEVFFYDLTAAPHINGNGEMIGITCAATNITEQKKVQEELQNLAQIDPLTQIANRRVFDQALDREWRLAMRNNSQISLVMIDVDAFKLYNDNYGHQAGDDCLVAISDALKETMKRPTDFLARYGGEEFVMVLPNTNADGAVKLAEAVREKVKSLRIPHGYSPAAQHITVSLGVTSMTPFNGCDSSELLSRADQALYHAKCFGKDRVVSFDRI